MVKPAKDKPRANQQSGDKKADKKAHKPPRTSRSREVTFIPQLTETDCGAASLASVLAFHGQHVPLHEVRTRLGTGRNGVTAKQILAAGRTFGFIARGVAIEPAKLRYVPAGSILHWNLAHFVVYEGQNRKGVQIVDPGVGRRRVPWSEVRTSLSGVALLFEPGQDFKREKPARSQRFRRYAGWMLSVRGVWGKILTASFFMQILALSTPGLMALVVDKVVPRGDVSLLQLIGAGFLVLTSFHFMSNLLRSRLLLELRTRVETRMSFHFVEHLLALPYAFFQQRTTGDLMMRMSSQAAIRELLTTGALSALLDGVLVSVYFLLLVGAAPSLAGIAVTIALLQVLIYMVGRKRNAELVVEGLAAQAQLEATQVEMLSGIETLKSMGATDRAMARWTDLYVNTLNRSIARGLLDGTFQSVLSTLRFCGPASLMLMGAYQVLEGSLSLGAMLGLSALGAGFLTPVANLVETALKLTQLHGYMERIEDVLETPREPQRVHASGDEDLRLAGALSVQDVEFKYPSEPEPTLAEVSFDVAPGECVAIVGASGSGKSTLARLLAGLYEPAQGAIAYDGRDLRAWDLGLLRTRLGIVTQDTRLFSGTIRDNVALFDSSIPLDAVEAACKVACIDETIQQMPMGYNTMLADGGSSLSGGQRQRLSLARALVQRPSVLILDEATSALDTVTERGVQEGLRSLACTRVIVAHRLSTVVDADKIIVMDRGRVVGVGKHHELVASCPDYAVLVQLQGYGEGQAQVQVRGQGLGQPRVLGSVEARSGDWPESAVRTVRMLPNLVVTSAAPAATDEPHVVARQYASEAPTLPAAARAPEAESPPVDPNEPVIEIDWGKKTERA